MNIWKQLQIAEFLQQHKSSSIDYRLIANDVIFESNDLEDQPKHRVLGISSTLAPNTMMVVTVVAIVDHNGGGGDLWLKTQNKV